MEGSGATGAGVTGGKAAGGKRGAPDERSLTRYMVFTVLEAGAPVGQMGEVLRRDGVVDAVSKDAAEREWTEKLEANGDPEGEPRVEFRCIPERGIDPVYGVELKQVTRAERSRR